MKEGRTVLQAKRYGIRSCRVDTSLYQAAQSMMDQEINTMIVVDTDGSLAGIITRSDVLRAYMGNDGWAQLPVGNFMSRSVVTVTPHTLLGDAARILLEHHVHQVVVVEETGDHQRPVAVISAGDLIYHLLKAAE